MSYGSSQQAQRDNFKWLDGSCTLPVDGYLCKFNFKGMCPRIEEGARGVVSYTTPFILVSTLLDYIPFGSVASVPCGGTRPDQSVLCMQKEDGYIGWSKDAPFCEDSHQRWCETNNGGCEHICIEEGNQYYCDCDPGYGLEDDGVSCSPTDYCEGNPCEYQCMSTDDSYHCSCPDGYVLAENGHDCLDIDECTQKTCEQLCVNTPGSFECQCQEGYQIEEGQCRDQDECMEDRCEHACENTEGSYRCHCHLGYSPAEDDPHQCADTDECRIPGTCHQMCVNYIGGFECHCNVGYELQADGFSCKPTPEAEDAYRWMPTFPIPTTGYMDVMEAWRPFWDEDTTTIVMMTQQPTESSTTEDSYEAQVETTTLKWRSTTQHEATTEVVSEVEASKTDRPMDFVTELLDLEDSHTPSLPASTVTKRDFLSTEPSEARQRATSGTVTVASSVSEKQPTTMAQHVTFSRKGGEGSARMPAPFTTTFSSAPDEASTPQSELGAKPKARQKRDDRWLIVALLVPVCIFLVILLALGIVYCTRCGAKSKNKSITDCYRWI
uniref:CD248 molecule n=2 Tax=Latimeria chalumnae TaxID=7897 RepID=H3ACE9_LATCH